MFNEHIEIPISKYRQTLDRLKIGTYKYFGKQADIIVTSDKEIQISIGIESLIVPVQLTRKEIEANLDYICGNGSEDFSNQESYVHFLANYIALGKYVETTFK